MQVEAVRAEQSLDRFSPPQFAPGLLNELCEQVLGAYSAAPHGGIEIGMVLFGKRTPDALRIEAWRPIPCSHLLGPRFILAPADESLIPEVLSTPQRDRALAGLEPVGWCCSHTRSELSLLTREIEFNERYFGKPGNVAAILKPRTPLQAEGAIFARKAKALENAEPLLRVQLPIREAPVAATRAVVVAATPPPVSVSVAIAAPTPPREALVELVHGWQTQRLGVLACLLGILVVLVYALWHEYPRPAPPPPITLSFTLKPKAAGLALIWKSNIFGARSAKIRIQDGLGSESIDLNDSFEPNGILLLPRETGNVQADLTVQTNGHTFMRHVAYSNPNIPQAEPIAKTESVSEPAPPPAHSAHRQRHTRKSIPTRTYPPRLH
ncbi:MAG TPA: hypothetical protein VH325_04290 [Bryobacteraceae bacterium]|jgi:hypothetical protein|nr:hypothetical protein [Bryobacteraceae bacterium]